MSETHTDSRPEPDLEPDPRATKAAAKEAARVERDAAKAAKREAKALARARRAELREQETAAKVESRRAAAAAKAAERVDTKTAEQESPEVLATVEHVPETDDDSEIFEPVRFDDEPTAEQTVVDVEPVVEDGGPVVEDTSVEQSVPEEKAPEEKAPEEKTDVRAEARAAAARRRVEARRRQAESKQARRDAKTATTAGAETDKKGRKKARTVPDDDHIVEPPRAPRLSFAERRRQAKADRAENKGARPAAAASTASSSPTGGGGRGRLLSLLAGTLGAVGLICSVILAIGALLVALGADESSAYDLVSGVCDVLVGPLRDAFSFTGANADMKESLVAWGAGSIAYLVIGLVAQSVLRPSSDT